MTTEPRRTAAAGWTADDSTFGARLALIRQRMAWGNVREAAVACGLPPESWRTWERDSVVPRRIVDVAALIAERTGCDYGWLLAGSRLAPEVALVVAEDPELNKILATPQEVRRPDVVRVATPRPIGHLRHDAVRPVSAIPANRRRPVTVRPSSRPTAA